MKLTWAAIVGLVLAVLRFFAPADKMAQWETKREAARKRLKEIDDELINVTAEMVHAKKNGQDAIAAALDMRRQRLLTARGDCQREYDYWIRRCGESR